MISERTERVRHRSVATGLCVVAAAVGGCSSDDETNATVDTVDTSAAAPAVTESSSVDASCDEIAARFASLGSANPDLPDPQVSATCADDTIVIVSNQIPDFPYVETTPGNPREFDLELSIPATPVVADAETDVPALGPLGIAVNGIPIYGPTEGTGGDVLAMQNFVECGGHNGPGGYHYHTFSVVGSDDCRFTEADVDAGPVLFGYAFDGYPIYAGNRLYTSSWYLDDPSLFATDTFSAHAYAEGSGDLDRCNGRSDENGAYAYYTTDEFPYTLACFRGVVEIVEPEGPGRARP